MYFCDKTQMMKKILSFIILFSISMLLKSQTGNVGVNTISPTHTLDVNGTFRVRKITQVGSSQSAKDSIMVFDEDGVVKYVSANAVVAEATAGNAKVLTNSTLTGNGSTGNELGIAQQGSTIGQVLTWNGTTWVPQAAAPVSTTNTISTSGNTITSNVNGVSSTAPSITSNNLNLTGNNLSTSVNGVASSNVDLTPYLDNTDNQNLSITGNNLSISGGNSVTLPSADGSETKVNAGTNISVTGSGTIASPYVINNTFTEIDGSTTNEIQTLNLSANTLSLSNGGGSVTLSGGTVTNVSGTAPISVVNGTTIPTISLTRNNLNTAASSSTATSPLTVTNGTNAVVNGADTSLAVNNTAPLWNANQLQGFNLSNTSPSNGQILKYNGTNWAPAVEAAASNWLITGNSNTTSSNFLGTTNDVLMSIRSNNTSMLEVGRRATLGLTVTSGGSNIFPYNDANNYLVHVKGNSGVSALQFEAGAASFYKPIFFTDTNGNFTLRGSSAGTDFFELGSSGTSNNGQLQFTVGDDGDEPIIFYRDRFDRTPRLREMLRMQGTGNNDNIRVGVNMNGSVANSTLQVNGSVSASILSVSSAITLDETHYTIILTNNSAITLPAASTCKGRIYIIKKTATGTATISAYLNSVGTSSTTITNGVLQLQSDGTSWQRIN